MIAVKMPCIRNLRGSTNLPESCRGPMPTSARWAAANLPKISEKTVHPAGAMWASPPTTGACKFALHIHKNILPSRRFGTRAYLLRGTTQIRKRLDTSLLRKGCGLRGPGDFDAVRLIRLLGGCPSRCCCKGLSASWPSLWAGRKPVLLPRRRKNQNYRIVFLFFIIMRQSRSPRCNPRISISAEARFVAHGTLDESHRRSVRMMR